MKCSFCGATNVKLDLITYNSKLVMVCVSCQLLDGIQGDK